MTKRLNALGMLLALALTASGCAAAQAFRQGEVQMRAGNLDEAVAAYRKAVQEAPDNANYRIALERAMQAASRFHLERARELDPRGNGIDYYIEIARKQLRETTREE